MTKVRFAPSPTGLLHIGNARTAIITWLFAQNQGGSMLLRIDDTDLERSKDEYIEALKEDLTWLGLNWDELAHQRQRLDRYDSVIEKLKADGRLYACYETPTELELKRKSLLSRGLPPIYDREALELSDEDKAKYEAEGRRPHWRFKLNHAPIEWDDLVRGPVSFHGKDMSDPVLIREDGSPLYHICSVIDDIDFDITHVIRGEDHVSNTATHVQMIEAVGGTVPTFAHLPLLTDSDGGKLSKRLGSLSLQEYRTQEGIEPMAIISLLARLGTSDPIEAFSDHKPLIDSFDFGKFSKGAPKCDVDELWRLNAKILHDMPHEKAQEKLNASCSGAMQISEEYWNAIRGNLEKFSDLKSYWDITDGDAQAVIDAEDEDFVALALEHMPAAPWDETTWGTWINVVKAESGRKGKSLFMPMRKALTGMEHGPELDKLLPLIGPEKVTERLSIARKAA
jgi:glutamyl-tRNA synthetase